MDKVPEGMPDFSKAYSPRKSFKLSRSMYFALLARIEELEKANKPERKRRTKAEIEADKAKELKNA